MQEPWDPLRGEAIAPPRASVAWLPALWANLRTGLRLALFLPVSRDDFRLTGTQAGFFVLVAAVLIVGLQAVAGLLRRRRYR